MYPSWFIIIVNKKLKYKLILSLRQIYFYNFDFYWLLLLNSNRYVITYKLCILKSIFFLSFR